MLQHIRSLCQNQTYSFCMWVKCLWPKLPGEVNYYLIIIALLIRTEGWLHRTIHGKTAHASIPVRSEYRKRKWKSLLKNIKTVLLWTGLAHRILGRQTGEWLGKDNYTPLKAPWKVSFRVLSLLSIYLEFPLWWKKWMSFSLTAGEHFWVPFCSFLSGNLKTSIVSWPLCPLRAVFMNKWDVMHAKSQNIIVWHANPGKIIVSPPLQQCWVMLETESPKTRFPEHLLPTRKGQGMSILSSSGCQLRSFTADIPTVMTFSPLCEKPQPRPCRCMLALQSHGIGAGHPMSPLSGWISISCSEFPW